MTRDCRILLLVAQLLLCCVAALAQETGSPQQAQPELPPRPDSNASPAEILRYRHAVEATLFPMRGVFRSMDLPDDGDLESVESAETRFEIYSYQRFRLTALPGEEDELLHVADGSRGIHLHKDRSLLEWYAPRALTGENYTHHSELAGVLYNIVYIVQPVREALDRMSYMTNKPDLSTARVLSREEQEVQVEWYDAYYGSTYTLTFDPTRDFVVTESTSKDDYADYFITRYSYGDIQAVRDTWISRSADGEHIYTDGGASAGRWRYSLEELEVQAPLKETDFDLAPYFARAETIDDYTRFSDWFEWWTLSYGRDQIPEAITAFFEAFPDWGPQLVRFLLIRALAVLLIVVSGTSAVVYALHLRRKRVERTSAISALTFLLVSLAASGGYTQDVEVESASVVYSSDWKGQQNLPMAHGGTAGGTQFALPDCLEACVSLYTVHIITWPKENRFHVSARP